MNKFALALFLILASCAHVDLVRSSKSVEVARAKEMNVNSYLLGFLTRRLPSEDQLCPGGHAEHIEFFSTGGDVALTIITLGIYIPHRMVYACSLHASPK